MTIKKQYKHYAVKMKIQLVMEFERKFLDDIWQIEIGHEKRILIRWFLGSMTLKQRRLRDKYQVVKDMSNFPVKFTTDNFNVTKEDATILKELYEECNIKKCENGNHGDRNTTYLIACCGRRIDKVDFF